MLKMLLIFLKKHKEVTKVIYSTEHDKLIADRAKKYLKWWKWTNGWY